MFKGVVVVVGVNVNVMERRVPFIITRKGRIEIFFSVFRDVLFCCY